jgi:hypothetical protein
MSSTVPPPRANNFVIGTTVINTHALGGLQIPDGWDQIPRWSGGWACTSYPGVLGSFPKREEPGKTRRHPVLTYRVPHGSHLKSKVRIAAAKVAALRINLKMDVA